MSERDLFLEFKDGEWLTNSLTNFIRTLGVQFVVNGNELGVTEIIFPKQRTIIVPCGLKKFYHRPTLAKEQLEFVRTNGSKYNVFCIDDKDQSPKYIDTKGFNTVLVWEHLWYHKQSIIESIIRSKLGLTTRIHARKCTLLQPRGLHGARAGMFLRHNHLHGADAILAGDVEHYGLTYNEHLVMVLCVRHMNDRLYEIVRVATLRNLTVVGGYTRLLSVFNNHLEPYFLLQTVDTDLHNPFLVNDVLGGFEPSQHHLTRCIPDELDNKFWVTPRFEYSNFQRIDYSLPFMGSGYVNRVIPMRIGAMLYEPKN